MSGRRGKRLARIAGGVALLASATIPAIPAVALPARSIAAPPEPQAHITLTLATAVTAAVVISVTFFLLGILCGLVWRRWRERRY